MAIFQILNTYSTRQRNIFGLRSLSIIHRDGFAMAGLQMKLGQVLKGGKDGYKVVKELRESIWTATRSNNTKVIVKTARGSRLQTEENVLRRFEGHQSLRQLLDHVDDPPCMVLEYLESDARQVSNKATLSKSDVKSIARGVLDALNSLHKDGIAHTGNMVDVKPDNILLNIGNGPSARVTDAKLADCGNAWYVGQNVDEAWNLHVTIQQARYFEPFPQSYQNWVTEDQWETLKGVVEYVNEDGLRKPFHLLEDEGLTNEDKKFLRKIMRMDPRDRPTAKELLEDEWFTDTSNGAVDEAKPG